MIVHNSGGTDSEVTTSRTFQTIGIHVSGVVMPLTVQEARAVRDLLIAMKLGDNP